jgi:hypothetical protein
MDAVDALTLCRGETVLIARRGPNRSRRVNVHRGDPEPDDDVGPDRVNVVRHKTRSDNRDVSSRIITCRKKGGIGDAPFVITIPCKQERAEKIDEEST